MIRKLFKIYRILATGFCFAVFYGLGAVFALLIPLGSRSIFPEEHQYRRRQIFTAAAFFAFRELLKGVGVIRGVDYRGMENIPEEEPFLLVANHPTLIDVILLVSKVKTVDCVVKQELWNDFFMGQIVRWNNYIPDRDSVALFEDCRERINAGRSILFFPEGTRSPKNDLQPFSRTVSQVALKTDCKVVPALIESNYSTLRRDQSWYEVPPEPFHLTITFFEPVEVASDQPMSIASRKFTRKLKSFYQRKLHIEE